MSLHFELRDKRRDELTNPLAAIESAALRLLLILGSGSLREPRASGHSCMGIEPVPSGL